jgi:hypothetical protein
MDPSRVPATAIRPASNASTPKSLLRAGGNSYGFLGRSSARCPIIGWAGAFRRILLSGAREGAAADVPAAGVRGTEELKAIALPAANTGMVVAGNVTDMAGAAGMPGWREMELGAPKIARLGMARLNTTRIAMLGTLRRDGSPRISPIEPYLVDGCLLVGAMTWSGKAADLRQDPRYALHSTVTGPDNGEGELKLYGLAVEASPGLRAEAADAWWSAQPPGKAIVFALGIARALFVAWDLQRGVMTVHRWSPQAGYSHSARAYP